MAGSDGALQLKALGARFKSLSDTSPSAALGSGRTLRAQALAGIRVATKPMVAAARQAAREELPKAGGFNEYVATSLIGTYTRITGPRVGVRIGVRSGPKAHRAYGANKGLIRHPVFADPSKTREQWRWVDQAVPAGWFDRTLEAESPVVVAAIRKVVDAVAVELTRRV